MTNTQELFLQTTPSTFIREGFPDTHTPYRHIVAIHEAMPMDTDEADGLIKVCLPVRHAEQLIKYKSDCYDANNKPSAEINCAHFAAKMGGIAVESYLEALYVFDKIEGSVVLSDQLPGGHLGVISSSEDTKEPLGLDHFVHAGIAVVVQPAGPDPSHVAMQAVTPENGWWLNVTGRQGNLALSRTADDLLYVRTHVPDWHPSVSDPYAVQLYDRGLYI